MRVKAALLWTLGVTAAVACAGAAIWFVRGVGTDVYTDGAELTTPVSGATPRSVLWTDPELRPIGTPAPEGHPAFAASDPETMYFSRGAPGTGADLYVTTRTRGAWSRPTPFTPANSNADELGPAVSPDGSAIYFHSDRAGGLGGYDLWVVRREGGAWSEPELVAGANSELHDTAPALSPDGRTLYFASNRLAFGEADLDPRAGAKRFQRDLDLYALDLTDAEAQPRRLNALSTTAHDTDPFVSPTGRFLYFASDRPAADPESSTGFDLFRARLTEDGPGFAERLGDEINTDANELAPLIGMDGFELRFASDRTGAGDLYRAVSREVYADTIVARPVIDWAELWKRIWPWLLALVICALLLWWLTRLLRETKWVGKWRTLGLMAWCTLLSACVHALLALLFTVLEVTSTLDGNDRGGGPRRVIVASSVGGGGGVASQVRASLSSATAEAVESQVSPAQLSQAASSSSSQVVEAASSQMTSRQSMAQAAQPDASSAIPSASVSSSTPSAQAPAMASASESSSVRTPQSEAPVARGDASSSPALASSSPSSAATPTASATMTSSSGPIAASAMPTNATSMAEGVPQLPGGSPSAASASASAASADVPSEVGESMALADGGLRTPSAGEATGDGDASVEFAAADLGGGSWEGSSEAPAGGATSMPEAPSMAVGGGVDLVSDQLASASAPSAGGSSAPSDALADAPMEIAAIDEFGLPGGADERVPAESDGFEVVPVASLALGADRSETYAATAGGLSPMDIDTDWAPASDASLVDGAPEVASSPIVRDDDPLVPDLAAMTDLPAFGGLSELSVPADAPALELTGLVLDAETREPIEDAVVRLDADGGDAIEVRTNDDGAFTLRPESTPDHAAVTATHPGYAPAAENVSAQAFGERASRVFLLDPLRPDRIAMEAEPEVHHIGDDSFSGRINSQFQKRSEGRVYEASFRIAAGQLEAGAYGRAVRRAEIGVLAKGAQLDNIIRINGTRLRTPLTDSPRDGSFGPFSARVPLELLREGRNTIQIESVRTNGTDHDDFEFVNVELSLIRGSSGSL